ncbi:MAG: Polymer-forming cytoskeletal [Chthoniobacteraceae bacterium]|nr:Polymer-forming cytoskeletal [Chthoniobacteraceae bacterium]
MTPSSTNFLNSDVEITGTITFDNELTCHGTVNGEILTSGVLIIAQSGVVNGNIDAGTVVIQGTVNGNVTATEKCHLHSNAQLIGDLKSPLLLIAEGATFIGNSQVVPSGSSPIVNFVPAKAAARAQ